MKTQEAANHFGSRVKLASALGISPAAITGWGDYPPLARQYQIQVLSKNKLKADPKPAQNHQAA